MGNFCTITTPTLFLLILTTLCCCCHGTKVKKTPKSDTASQQYRSSSELELFAFGVSAQLGSLYDIRTQTFLNTTIFSTPIFNDELVITEGHESTYESEGLVEKPSDEFRLLDLNPRQALGILLGQGASIPSRGSTGFLWNVDHQGVDSSTENGDERIEGSFKYSIKYLKTAEERLNLKHAHLPFGIDFVKLKETRATHVLIKIQYGVGLTVRIPLSTPRLFNSKAKMNFESSDSHQEDSLSSLLRLSTSSNEGPEVFTDIDLEELNMELEKIKNKMREKSAVTFDDEKVVEDETEVEVAVENGTEIPATTNSNSSLKTRENSKKNKFSRADAEALLRTFPHHLNGFRKGIPLKYVLVSVRDFLKNFIDDDSTELTDIPQRAHPNSQLDYYNLERALSTFDGITLLRRTLAQLESNVNRYQDLLRNEDLRRIAITKRHFLKTTNKLKRDLKRTLAKNAGDESQNQDGSDLNREVSTLLEHYHENIYSFAHVNDSLRSIEFKHVLETMKLFGYIKSTGVVYLGRGATVDQLQLNGNDNDKDNEGDNDNDAYEGGEQGLYQDPVEKVPPKRTYVLFFKDLATVSSKLKWLQTRSLFFNLRFQGGITSSGIDGLNKLVVVDCNFAWAFEECENIWDQPVIHEYYGNTLITDNYPNQLTKNFQKFTNGLNSSTNNISEQDVSVVKSLTRRLVEELHVLKRSGNRVINEVQVFHNEGENRLKSGVKGQLRDLTYSLRGTLYNIQYELVDAEEEIQNFLRYFLSLSTEKQAKIRTSSVKTGLRQKNKSSSRTKTKSSLKTRSRSGLTRRRNSRARSEAFTFPNKHSDSSFSSNHGSVQEKSVKRRKSNVKLNQKHSSQSHPTIIESGVSLAERKEIVDRHNTLRKFVASGMETRGVSGPQPAALFMSTLQWDEQLAKEAQKIADTTETVSNKQKLNHGSFQDFGTNVKVRGNFFNQTRKNPVLPSDWTGTIDRWYDQVASFDSKNIGKFQSSPINTDAYSQMVWAKTNRIGCGYAQFTATNEKGQDGTRRLYVCNYSPKGNNRDEPVYAIRKRG